MPASRADAKQNNRDALLAAARDVVARDGASASLATIAAAADLTTGAIYSIFGSKRDLLGALLMQDVEQIEPTGSEFADPELSLRELLGRTADSWLRRYHAAFYAQGAFGCQVVLAATRDARLREKIAVAMTTEVDQLTERLCDRPFGNSGKRTSKAQAELVATVLKATLSGFAFRHLMMREPLPDQVIRDACQALAGLVPDAEGRPGRRPNQTRTGTLSAQMGGADRPVFPAAARTAPERNTRTEHEGQQG